MLNSFVLCCNFCACKCACTVVVRSPRGGVGDRHLVTVPQGVVGDRLPWGGEGQGGGVGLQVVPPPKGGTVTWPMNNKKSIGNHRRHCRVVSAPPPRGWGAPGGRGNRRPWGGDGHGGGYLFGVLVFLGYAVLKLSPSANVLTFCCFPQCHPCICTPLPLSDCYTKRIDLHLNQLGMECNGGMRH